MTDLDDLRAELDEFAHSQKKGGRPPLEERIIAGFEEIQRFVEQHGRAPEHGEDKDIFERLYAVRLDRLRSLGDAKALLVSIDHQGLLCGIEAAQAKPVESLNEDELLAELGDTEARQSSITELRHVRSRAEIRVAEEIANREACNDFGRFQPLFEQAEADLKSGARQAQPFGKDTSINAGDFFIVGGQIVYVAVVGETIRAPNGEPDARLRLIYANGTESNLLLRSLQRALYKDEAGRRLVSSNLGPLFGGTWDDGDFESGTIYVLRSLSDHSFIAENRKLVHKIGVTGGTVEARIANAEHDATYLLADVEVVATYKLSGINRTKLENILHRVFSPAHLNLTIHDRFGHPVQPREWFLVPLHMIDEAIQRIRDGSITEVVYDPNTVRLVQTNSCP